MKNTTHISLNKVSEGEVFPGEEESPFQKLLAAFAFFPQCHLKQVWIIARRKEHILNK